MTASLAVWVTLWREGMPSRGKGCHPEGTGQAAEVGTYKPHDVQQSRVQGPEPGLEQSQTQNTGLVKNGLRAALGRKIWECWLTRSSTWPSSVCLKPRKPNVSWASPRGATRGQERWFPHSALTFWDATCSTMSSSAAPNIRRICWNESRGGPKGDQRGEAHLSTRQLGLFSLEKRMLWGLFIAPFSS